MRASVKHQFPFLKNKTPLRVVVPPKMILGNEFPSARFQCGIRIADCGMGRDAPASEEKPDGLGLRQSSAALGT